jgi:predicted helicase
VIKQIYAKFQGQEGIWSQYVEDHLIPRLNGFEILMASYAMAHLKLELLLRETGYKPKNEQRLRVYLTNSLEEYHPDTGTLFASWLSSEANEANKVKRDTPVMIVIGNPPYSISSSNKSEWIEGLIVSYKQGLNERNIQPLSDDYIKFLRFGQFFIDKTGEGILAFISNNTFLDGIIHRQMRRNLLESFDKTFILDLHGSTKKRESAPDGSKDENVFDIMQGVSINIFIKTRKSKDRALGDVYLANCWGKREYKYNFLYRNNLKSVSWEKINYQPDSYMFRKFSITRMTEYEKLLKITDLFPFKTSGVKTHDDANLVSHNIEELKDKVVSQYQYFDQSKVYKYSYRPFDIEYILYDTSLLGRSREKTIYHLKQDNIGLVLVAQSQAANLNYFDCVFVTNILTDTNMFRRGGPSIFPAYLYNRDISQGFVEQDCIRKPNLNMGVIATIAHKLDLPFTSEKGLNGTEFSTIDILDYVYATLHSPSYREKYKEFLKIDFPRIPYPKDKETFWQLVALGGELRQIHLLESPMVNQFITSYPIPGTNNVEKVTWDDYRVWINKDQYFDGVPVIAWEFYIGGYQPAQKWLKDRKGRELSYDDIRHYQKIIVALAETDRIMKEIDKISIE